MKRIERQAGYGIWSLAFFLFLLGVAVFTALKLVPPYMEYFNVSGALSTMESEAEEYVGAMSVHTAVMKRFYVNNVSRVKSEDVSVVRDLQSERYNIEVDYDVIIPYFGNISFLLNFRTAASVRASGY